MASRARSSTGRKGGIKPRLNARDNTIDAKAPSPGALISRKADAVTNLAHAALGILAGEATSNKDSKPLVSEHCVNAFCSLLQSGKLKPALNFARLFVSRGADYGDLAEDLFSAAARRMGERWTDKRASKLQVNVGIETLIRTHIALCSNRGNQQKARKASALFGSFHGQAHTLGLAFGAEYFHRNGWNVHYMPGTSINKFLATASAQAPDLVGLTAAVDNDIATLNDVIDRLKKLPRKPRIIVGGCSADLADLDADAIVTRLDIALLAGHSLVH